MRVFPILRKCAKLWNSISINISIILGRFHVLTKLSYKLSLLNSHQLLFSFDQDMSHESWENSQTNSRLSTLINSCSRLTRTWELRKLSYKLSLVNSHQLLLSFDQDMRVEKTRTDSRVTNVFKDFSRYIHILFIYKIWYNFGII